MMDFCSDETRRNPYPVYDRMRSGSPLLHVPETDRWMIFEMAARIFTSCSISFPDSK